MKQEPQQKPQQEPLKPHSPEELGAAYLKMLQPAKLPKAQAYAESYLRRKKES